MHRASLRFEGEINPVNPELSANKSRKQSETLKEAAQMKVLEEVLQELQLAVHVFRKVMLICSSSQGMMGEP